MKTFFYTLESVSEIDLDITPILAIESDNFNFFRSLMRDLKEVDEEGKEIAFYDKENALLLNKDYLLLLDYFDTDVLSKSVNTKVVKQLSCKLEQDVTARLEFMSKLSSLYAFTISRLDDTEIIFESEGERSFEEVLKLFSVSVAQPRNDILSKITNLIEVSAELKLFKLFVFVNAKSFFDKKELFEVIKMAKYHDLPIVFIDNCISGEKILDEKLLVVDEDFFVKTV